MSNVFDYLKWRGDLSFQQDGFNEVDNLVFAGLSYIDYEGVVPTGTCAHSITMAQAAAQLKAENRLELKGLFLTRYPELLVEAAQTERYKDVRLTCYISQMDEVNPNQFSAIVFSISTKEHYIAFRGTDDNLAGWKEDFLMSFKDTVTAQKQAVKYVNFVIPQLRGSIYIGGHSKGGNLAVFAAARTSDRLRRKIAAIYSNDSPGFHTSIIMSDGYKKIENRIAAFIPKSSVVGMLLEHGEDCKIISSSEKGILSHNPLTWAVIGTTFVHENELSKSSRQINDTLRSWLSTVTMEQREQFVEALFDVISASGAQTLSDLSKERLLNIDAMIKKFISMDKVTRKMLRDTVITFFSVRQRIFMESINQSLDTLMVKKI